MFSDRYSARSSIGFPTTGFDGAVSRIALFVFFFANIALGSAHACELKDITNETNATAATRENFKKLAECVKELEARLAKIQNSAGTVTINATDGAFAGSGGSVGGYAGTFSLENDKFVACPPGAFVSAIQGFKPDGQAPIVQIRYACRSVK